jgi:hypothetical protein
MQIVKSVVTVGEPKSAFPTTPLLRHFQLTTSLESVEPCLSSNVLLPDSATMQSSRGACEQKGGGIVVVVTVVVVTVVVVGGAPAPSSAPMSHRTPCGRATPR